MPPELGDLKSKIAAEELAKYLLILENWVFPSVLILLLCKFVFRAPTGIGAMDSVAPPTPIGASSEIVPTRPPISALDAAMAATLAAISVPSPHSG